MASMTTVKCKNCKTPFEARTVDVKRGWGKYCSKSCKAKMQTKQTGISGPDYRAKNRTVGEMRSGKFSKSKLGKSQPSNGERWYRSNIHFDVWDEEVENGDAKYSHKYGCWLVRDDGINDVDAHPFDSEAAGFNNQ